MMTAATGHDQSTRPAASKFLTSAVRWLSICMADSTTVILLAACAQSDTSNRRIRQNLIALQSIESLEAMRAGRTRLGRNTYRAATGFGRDEAGTAARSSI
ncbi:hypothetical protein JB92DRAFT_2836649 [Gautieria morchelliformis]|nr:hypothetical protein JB92DRAFT_2836649 [Gautieria morchelliformis]